MQIPPRTWAGVVGGIALSLAVASPVSAGEGLSSYVNGSLRKLGRGIANVATAVGELPRVTALVGRESGYLAASSVGLLKGTWRTVLRAVAGAYEVATFFIEIPKDFKPLIKPEFVFALGDWGD